MRKPKTQNSDPSVELYQSVWITFSDGTRAGYIGQAKALPGDTRTIEKIEFTEPKPLSVNRKLPTVKSTGIPITQQEIDDK